MFHLASWILGGCIPRFILLHFPGMTCNQCNTAKTQEAEKSSHDFAY
jgi:hypothetical protein